MPACFTGDGINRFFSITVLRPDVKVSSFDDVLMNDHVTDDSISLDLHGVRVYKCSSPNNSCDILSNLFCNINISDSNNHMVKQKECNSLAGHKEIKYVSWGPKLIDSDATSHATTDSLSMRNDGDFSKTFPTSSGTCTLQSGRDYRAHHLSYQSEKGKEIDVRDDTNPPHHGILAKRFRGRSHHSFEEPTNHREFSGSSPPLPRDNSYYSSTRLMVSCSVLTTEISQPGGITNNIVSGLTGDLNRNFHNRLYAQGLRQDNPTNPFDYPMRAPPPVRYRNMRPSGYVSTKGTGTYFPDPVSYL